MCSSLRNKQKNENSSTIKEPIKRQSMNQTNSIICKTETCGAYIRVYKKAEAAVIKQTEKVPCIIDMGAQTNRSVLLCVFPQLCL